jgi:hypothetical protein
MCGPCGEEVVVDGQGRVISLHQRTHQSDFLYPYCTCRSENISPSMIEGDSAFRANEISFKRPALSQISQRATRLLCARSNKSRQNADIYPFKKAHTISKSTMGLFVEC